MSPLLRFASFLLVRAAPGLAYICAAEAIVAGWVIIGAAR